MQTGKILGIGAALSAGLLAAHVASASVVTGVEIAFNGQTLAVGSSAYANGEVYSTSPGSGNYQVGATSSAPAGANVYFTWTGISVSDVAAGSSELTLTVSGLTNADPGAVTSTIGFVASGQNFTFLPTSGDATLAASGSGSYSGAVGTGQTGSDYASTAGAVNLSNILYDTTGTNISTATATQYASSSSPNSSYTLATAAVDATQNGLGSPPSYSLTDYAAFNLISPGTTYGGTFATTLSGAASAVSLPGSGPLTIIGGLVMVGGLAIRRRIKV